jgi:arylsulfatase
MPTFIEITGATYPEQHRGDTVYPPEGVSLLPVFQDERIQRDKSLFWKWRRGEAMLKDSFKIVREGLDNEWELYNLVADPAETNNLASEYPGIVERMSEDHMRWEERVK